MSKLSDEAVLSHHRSQEVSGTEVSVSSLDEEREWLELACSNGHRVIAEAHEGGSIAVCGQCSERVDYRDDPEPEPETQTVSDADVADVHEVLGSDTARSAEAT